MEQQIDPKEQKRLKTLDKFQQITGKAVYVFSTGIFGILALLSLAKTIYCGISILNGTDSENRFLHNLQFTILFAALSAGFLFLGRLLDKGIIKLHHKDLRFDPASMELPAAGTVSLETALHKMALKTGVIVWDTLFGFLLFFFFVLGIAVPGSKTDVILIICAVLAVLLLAGHFLFNRHWQKKSFTGRLLKNTQKYLALENPSAFTEAIEASLRKNILYYSRELILTDDYIIGITESDTSFLPAALPREGIWQISFYNKKLVTNSHPYIIGILNCKMTDSKPVEFLIGRGTRPDRVLNVLNYYGIPWRKEETIYR